MRFQIGFTLVETMITIFLVSILISIGLPSFNSMLRNVATVTQANNFIAAVNYARSEAIRRNNTVIMSALTSNLPQNHWELGWRIWIDSNGNNHFDDSELLMTDVNQGFEGSIEIISNISTIRFNSNGFLDDRQQSGLLFSLQQVPCSRDESRHIIITSVGRPSILADGSECR